MMYCQLTHILLLFFFAAAFFAAGFFFAAVFFADFALAALPFFFPGARRLPRVVKKAPTATFLCCLVASCITSSSLSWKSKLFTLSLYTRDTSGLLYNPTFGRTPNLFLSAIPPHPYSVGEREGEEEELELMRLLGILFCEFSFIRIYFFWRRM